METFERPIRPVRDNVKFGKIQRTALISKEMLKIDLDFFANYEYIVLEEYFKTWQRK